MKCPFRWHVIYVCFLGQWDVSLDPIEQIVLTEMQSNIVHNCSEENTSSTWIAAVVIAIAHNHTSRFQEQSIQTVC